MSETPFADLTDVTLADDDTNPLLPDNPNPWQCDNASYATWCPTLKTMQVAPPDDQI